MRKLLISFLFIAVIVQAQQWSGILDPSRAITWNPGATISSTRTQSGSTIAAYGSVGTPASCGTINTALAAAAPNTYVLLGAGTFYLFVFERVSTNATITPQGLITTGGTLSILPGSVCRWNP